MEPLTALLLIVALCVAGVAGAAVAVRRNHQRSNEVVPGVATAAPDSWAGAHTPEARLHRRIRDAVAAVRGLPSGLGVDASVAEAVGQEALAVDEQLVAVARLPEGQARTDAIAQVSSAVESLEQAVAGLLTGTEAGRSSVSRHVDDARIRRQALLDARREVEQIDGGASPDLGAASEPHPPPRQEPGQEPGA